MTPTSSAALQTAALPFILPWKGLVQGLDVVSLGPAPEGWKRLLAGQGIALRESSRDAVPQGCRVASGFDRLDGLTESDLAAWAKAALEALTPGGILVLGGTEPEMAPAGQAALSALRAAHLLEAEGFARTRVLSPAAPFYAVVVQAPARGAAFDVFSPVFLATPPPAESTALARSEAALHQRLQQLEHHLQRRADRTEADLRDQLQRAEARLNDQAQEIEGLRATIAALQRLTRRRGLRKLAHKIKQARRKDKEAAALPPAPASTPPAAALPAPTEHTTPPPANPTPLSARETALRAQLFDSGNA